jgi:hypothetical protein
MHAHDRDAMLNARRGMIVVRMAGERRSKRRIILGPLILLKTMLYDPLRRLDRKSLIAIYSIDTERHHDFFIVTVSRLCYYCGGSVQTVRLLQTFYLIFLLCAPLLLTDTCSMAVLSLFSPRYCPYRRCRIFRSLLGGLGSNLGGSHLLSSGTGIGSHIWWKAKTLCLPCLCYFGRGHLCHDLCKYVARYGHSLLGLWRWEWDVLDHGNQFGRRYTTRKLRGWSLRRTCPVAWK